MLAVVGVSLAMGCQHGGLAGARRPETPTVVTTELVPWNSGDAAAALCSRAFGTGALNSAPASVGEVRGWVTGPRTQLGAAAFPGAAPSQFAAWCWTGSAGAYRSYAVGPDGNSLFMGGISGPNITDLPDPGPPRIP